ncbi:5-formyltetrahydrofolate cyclo-ligase [Lapidilactobacillus bayanensis]|uniref:5-formyltetrahydrofolate cyclo-ligase n=1 Tax=Lapidilactobacillus bayanensis TaxID=2485998 RepID=UPI000F77A5BC|nr:5-formyltetrahydrofolate cyclo-ligase [Lapidilactobacillus bayanensis]
MTSKKAIRLKQINQLKQVAAQTKLAWEQDLYQQLWQDPVFDSAETIGLTYSGAIEVNTLPIIERAFELGKEVYLPRTDPTTHKMNFIRYDEGDQLEKSDFGIREPLADPSKIENYLDLIIVPGLLFTKYPHWRIGFGGGYYDRFLSTYPAATISLAFPFMVCAELDWETFIYDRLVDHVIVEKA